MTKALQPKPGTGIRVGLTALLCLAAMASAADPQVRFDIQPRLIEMGETATARLTIDGAAQAPAPSLPTVDGLRISSAGTQSSFTMGTGGRSQSITHTYRLFPTRTGAFTLGPWTYRIGKKEYPLPAVTLKVVASKQSNGQNEQVNDISDILFARLTAQPDEVYAHQPFDLVLEIYHRGLNIGRDIALQDLPDEGLDIEPFQELQPGRKVINGTLFEVRRFRTRIRPLTSGDFLINPRLRVPIRIPRERRRSHSFFDDPFFNFGGSLFGDAYRTQQVDITPAPAEIQVLALPDDEQPEAFGGAVGQFNMEVDITPSIVQAGDPVTVQIRITGQGNLDRITLPNIEPGPEFKSYDIRLTDQQLNNARDSGTLTFEQVLIPKSGAVASIPAIRFVFFDPDQKSYVVLEKGPFPLEVSEATGHSMELTPGIAGSGDERRPQILGQDIVYLKPAPKNLHPVTPVEYWRSTGFRALLLAPALAALGVYLYARRREYLDRDRAAARRLAAPKQARKQLDNVRKALEAGRITEAYDALFAAAVDYFSHRLNLAPGEVSREIIRTALRKAGLTAEAESLDRMLEQCEQARYGMGAMDAADRSLDLDKAADHMRTLLRTCEKHRLKTS